MSVDTRSVLTRVSPLLLKATNITDVIEAAGRDNLYSGDAQHVKLAALAAAAFYQDIANQLHDIGNSIDAVV